MSSDPPFPDWLAAHHQPKTQIAYTHAVAQFCAWFEAQAGESADVASLTKLDVAHYRRDLQAQGKAPSTINKALAALRAWCTWAIEASVREDNPVLGMKRVGDTKKTIAPKGLKDGEAGRLLKHAQTSRHAVRDLTILTLLLQTGLRISEVVAVNWGDIMVGERSGTLTVRQGKGNKQRAVPLSQTARQALYDWAVVAESLEIPPAKRWSKAHADQLMTGIATHPLRPLFSSQKGGRLNERTIQTMVQDAARRAGLVDVTPHTLRHTCAFQLLKAGATLVEVAQILGHTSIATTQIYTGSSIQHLQAAVERIGWE